jgi:hypothetical protein
MTPHTSSIRFETVRTRKGCRKAIQTAGDRRQENISSTHSEGERPARQGPADYLNTTTTKYLRWATKKEPHASHLVTPRRDHATCTTESGKAKMKVQMMTCHSDSITKYVYTTLRRCSHPLVPRNAIFNYAMSSLELREGSLGAEDKARSPRPLSLPTAASWYVSSVNGGRRAQFTLHCTVWLKDTQRRTQHAALSTRPLLSSLPRPPKHCTALCGRN